MSLHHVSASQVDLFRRCPRLWFYERVLDKRRPASPAMLGGKEIHTKIETWVQTGELPAADDPHFGLVVGASQIIVRHPRLRVELEFKIETYKGGPDWVGFIDLFDPDAVPVKITDHKTISDLRYIKTPEEIRTNVQMISYAKWAIDEFKQDSAAVGHLYYRTRGKAKVIEGPIEVVDRQHVEEQWGDFLGTVREMVAVSEADNRDPMEVPPNTESCGMYGGCYFRQDCGLFPSLFQIKSSPKKENQNMATLSEKLAAKNGTPVVATDTCPRCLGNKLIDVDGIKKICTDCKGSGVFSGASLIPPDAPPRTDQPGDPTAEEAGAKKKKSKKKDPEIVIKVEGADGVMRPIEEAAPPAPISTRKTPKKAPTIYVDCYPLKGEDRPVPFEEWLAPIQQAIAETNNVPDYGMIPYTAKAVLAAAIQMSLDTLPEILYVKQSHRASDVFLEVVAPYSKKLVQRA